jgi:RNA polymerase-binding transcription factor DksA
VNQAFERIRENTYGQCVNDNSVLSRTLLEQVPWARFCETCATRHT